MEKCSPSNRASASMVRRCEFRFSSFSSVTISSMAPPYGNASYKILFKRGVSSTLQTFVNNRILGLAKLLLKCLFIFGFLWTVLWIIPRFISIDNHTQSVLRRLNNGPGEFSLENAELQLVPHLSVHVRQANFSVKRANESSEVFAH